MYVADMLFYAELYIVIAFVLAKAGCAVAERAPRRSQDHVPTLLADVPVKLPVCPKFKLSIPKVRQVVAPSAN